ncbi:unnamed protein product, partial [Rotaria sp. Silwood1]
LASTIQNYTIQINTTQ